MDVRRHTGTPVSDRRQHRWVTVAMLAMLLISAACGSSKAQSIAPTTASAHSVAPSTTTAAQVQAMIISQWRAAQQASLAAAKDPANPGQVLLLDNYFVDPELSFLRTQYAARARDGFKTVGSEDLGNPRVESLTATQAVVATCGTDSLAIVNAATGKPMPGPAGDPTPTQAGVRATLVLQPSGVWKVSNTGGKEGSCVGF
jgi:hypothetical protein